MAGTANMAAADGVTGGQIISPISITPLLALQFGAIVQPQTGGTVTISPISAIGVTTDLGAAVAITQPILRRAAAFRVTGEANARYTVTLPATIQLSNGSATMTVSAFTSSLSLASGIGQISAIGTHIFQVGATLSVAAGQAVGSYSGTYPVTVQYQ